MNNYIGPRGSLARENLDELEKSKEFVFDEKINGRWVQIITDDSGCIASIRNRIGLPVNYGEVVHNQQGEFCPSIVSCRALLVGELTKNCLYLFDIIEHAGKDVRSLSLTARRDLLERICFEGPYVRLVEFRRFGAERFYEEILARGGEGIMIKRKDSLYKEGVDWYRLKPQRTVDMVVMGNIPSRGGKKEVVQLGLYHGGNLVPTQRCVLPSFPLAVGDVVEISGSDKFTSGALQNGKITRKRQDKFARDCTVEAARRA